jgi:malonate decarboxylase epsilon subunit
LASTTNAQLTLLICGVATARTLTDDHGVRPDVVAGHSAGAFAAAVGAGVLTFAEAVAAVRVRGDAMARACETGQWGMAALTGLRLRAVRDLVDSAPDALWIANINAADQVVLGGTIAALDSARQAAQRAGARRFEMLDVAVASHGPIQAGTARAVAQQLSTIPGRDLHALYMTNVGARRIRDAAAVLDDLATAVAHPVRWFDIVRMLPEIGVVATVEMPPGDVLSRLVTATTSTLHVFSVAENGLGSISARLRSPLFGAVPQPQHGVEDLLGPT